MNRWTKWTALLLGLLVLSLITAVFSLTVGEMPIRLGDLPTIMRGDSIEYRVLRYIRLPRMILALSVGGSLSLAGCLLQGVFRNPLVEPYTMGLSGGASLGVAICIVFGVSSLQYIWLPISGFIGSLAVMGVIYALSLRRRSVEVQRMLLIGVMISFVTSSAVLFIEAIAHPEDLQKIILWSMGSLTQSDNGMVIGMAVLSLLLLLISCLFATPMNAMRLGLRGAGHLGLDTRRTVRWLFVISSLATGCSIAVAGVIGFVGLVIPHVIRITIGNDYRVVIPASFLLGGLFLLLCDLVARTIIAPNELPIGVITGIVGGLLFIILLTRPRSRKPLL